MRRSIGVDAGGSLVKIAFEEKGSIHYKTYPVEDIDTLVNWLKLSASDAIFKLTGGKANYLKERLGNESIMIDEFQTIVDGVRLLLMEQNEVINDFILVSIGTGTSIYHVQKDHNERMFGTGIGGGTLIGLGAKLASTSDFHQIIKLAAKGDHKRSDLLVKDIYDRHSPPILADLTAANFGKAHKQNALKEDLLASLVQLIGETIILLASSAAQMKNSKTIVFSGGTLAGNTVLKEVLLSFQEMLGYQMIILENGEFAGARGALSTEV
ncbi:type II pantothenate kinase [Caldibacillus lycopersici]|uniref:Type II pantothenate kinase n=1 Tax=Perspicuibacillus lycopersici TaxID=1325689 RepID=A0AAE3INY7_9BACI|nr:type II pantothenate kinase [Perspicuibacillus lycopersici]MCU9611948.1 type II pantothenate kinase [Perspicuibacillus lycopersici]